MPNSFKCPNCGQNLSAKPELAGRIISCPTCGSQTQVPSANVQQDDHLPTAAPSAPGSPLPYYPPQGHAGMYSTSRTGGQESKWGKFLSFDIMIADEFLAKIWLVASVIVLIVSVFGFFVVLLDELGVEFAGVNFHSTGKAFNSFWRIFEPLVTGALTLLMLRITCEFMVLFFKIHATIKEIKDGKSSSVQ